MPWKVKDVDKFKKGLSDKEKRKWISIANAALKECTAQDGDKIECESQAIRIANSRVGKKVESKLSETHYIEDAIITEDGRDIETRLMLALGEEADPDTDDFQMVLPVGLFYDGWYGEIIITNSYAEAMVANWKAKVLGNRDPFIDTGHDRGAANGWIEDLEARDDGLYAKIRWTNQGREYVEGELYKYFSAEIGRVTKIEDGLSVFPVLIAVALCNTPVMNTMAQAHLSEGGQWSPVKGATTVINNQGSTPPDISITADQIDDTGDKTVETFTLVLAALLALSEDEKGKATDAEKAQVAQFLGLKLSDPTQGETLKLVLAEKKVLAERLAKIEGDNLTTRIDSEIKKALTEGKILPANEQKWRDLMAKDPDGVIAILADKGPEIDLGEHGHGDGGQEGEQMSDNERKVHDALGHTEEDIKKFGG